MRRVVILLAVLMLVLLAAVPALAATRISIPKAHYDARGNDNYRENLNDEYIVFKNNTNRAISMRGYKVHDEGREHTYRFPNAYKLRAGKSVTLHTGKGRNSATHLYWQRSYGAVWNNEGDTVFLKDAKNQLVVKRSW